MLKHLRKPVLAAALALLALPGAALATDDGGSKRHRNFSEESAQSGDAVAKYQIVWPLTLIAHDECVYLELNIPGYDCAIPLAEYAGEAEQPGLPPTPDGIDYLFWEQNYWVFADGRATFPEDAEPPRPDTANLPQGGRGMGYF